MKCKWVTCVSLIATTSVRYQHFAIVFSNRPVFEQFRIIGVSGCVKMAKIAKTREQSSGGSIELPMWYCDNEMFVY